jgi:Cdc6-like AAA superfamily ATPase
MDAPVVIGSDEWWRSLALKVSRAFTPNTPVDKRALFAGRADQMIKIVDVINSPGQHAILFGDRGVGKTSLANVLSETLPRQPGPKPPTVIAPRVQCDGGDTFKSVWIKVFDQIELSGRAHVLGFDRPEKNAKFSSKDLLGKEKVTPDSVRRVLTIMAQGTVPILIIDEFDRLRQEPRRAFADLVKNLSDNAVGATIVLVGVADSIGSLIDEHQSVTRALVQVQVPRMVDVEIREILEKGTSRLGMTIDPPAQDRIVLLSQGLPHYAHLMGKHSARMAINARSLAITLDHVNAAIEKAIGDAQHSIRSAYNFAVRSPRKHNLFANVLLACALADTDELGYFAAQGVRDPLRKLTGEDYGIPTFAQHLSEFSDDKRGKVLHKTGKRYRFRYRFSDPLMQPFVIMEGMARHALPEDFLSRGRSASVTDSAHGGAENGQSEGELGPLFEAPAN